jgi:uridine kinase
MTVHLIAITGGSGSGKTWMAERLVAQFAPDAARVALDDFYRDLSHLPVEARASVNFDHPGSIDWPLFRRSLRTIGACQPTALPQYDFVTHTRRESSVPWQSRPLVVLDGLWLLRRLEFRRLYALRVFVDCPEAIRLQRRCDRDQKERGRSADSVRSQFETHVAPMHRRFVAGQARHADMIIDASVLETGLAELTTRCRMLLPKQTPT